MTNQTLQIREVGDTSHSIEGKVSHFAYLECINDLKSSRILLYDSLNPWFFAREGGVLR